MIQEELRHLWSDEEGSDGSLPVTEHYAFRDLPSDEEIAAVLDGTANFIPRNECYVRKIANMWRKHLLSTGQPAEEVHTDCNDLIHTGFLLEMGKSDEAAHRRASRAIQIPLITLARARKDGKTFQMPNIETIRQRLATGRTM
jgi:hypothetical protein